jgi:hypothetical protein
VNSSRANKLFLWWNTQLGSHDIIVPCHWRIFSKTNGPTLDISSVLSRNRLKSWQERSYSSFDLQMGVIQEWDQEKRIRRVILNIQNFEQKGSLLGYMIYQSFPSTVNQVPATLESMNMWAYFIDKMIDLRNLSGISA